MGNENKSDTFTQEEFDNLMKAINESLARPFVFRTELDLRFLPPWLDTAQWTLDPLSKSTTEEDNQ